jgi:excisionase family DNA binding protein
MNSQLGVAPIEAARLLGVSRSTIYRIMNRGQLRTVKIGRRTIIPVSAITALLEEGSTSK